MARFAFFFAVLAFVCVGVTFSADETWDEIDLSKLYHQPAAVIDPAFSKPILGGPDDPDHPNRPIPGGPGDPDHPTNRPIIGGDDHDRFGELDDVTIPADATALLNCSSIEQLERHHHNSCGVRYGYSTHHCHCDWGNCREHRAHSWCGCPWGKCHQDRPKYCALVWKYCAHHHHKPGIEPRGVQPANEADDFVPVPYIIPSTNTTALTTTGAPTTKAPTTAAPTTKAPTTTAPTTKAPTTAAPTTKAPTTEAPTPAPTHRPTHHPSYKCGPWGYTTFACMCPMGSCYSRHRPHGYCGCPYGYCKNKRPEFCRYYWKFCPQPHCGAQKPITPIEVQTPEPTRWVPQPTETPQPPKPSEKCGKYGVASDKCKCSWYRCSLPRPSGECGCPWGKCREYRPYECKTEVPKIEDLDQKDQDSAHNHGHGHHHQHHHHGNQSVDCGKYGNPSEKCKCGPHQCRFHPYRPSYECGCPWGYCKDDRPNECKAEAPDATVLRPEIAKPKPTHDYKLHEKCGSLGVATQECQCLPGNCRIDRPSDECGCPWGVCDQRRPYACKWRGTENHGHGPAPTPDNHDHHHRPGHHHHHHHHHHHSSSESGSSESKSSESWESDEDNNDKHHHGGRKPRPAFDEDPEADKMQMILYGAMGFLICSLGFLFMVTMFSMIMRRMRTPAGSTYRNLAATPVELIRNPMENFNQKPEDKEKLIKHNE